MKPLLLFTILCSLFIVALRKLAPFAWLVAGLLCLAPFILHAQTPVTPAPAAVPPDVPNFILTFLSGLIASSPKLATVVGVMGTMRLWAKPVFSIVHQVIDLTPSTKDDALLGAVTNWFANNPIGKLLAYLLDWLTSIKIVPIQAVPTVTNATPAKPAGG